MKLDETDRRDRRLWELLEQAPEVLEPRPHFAAKVSARIARQRAQRRHFRWCAGGAMAGALAVICLLLAWGGPERSEPGSGPMDFPLLVEYEAILHLDEFLLIVEDEAWSESYSL